MQYDWQEGQKTTAQMLHMLHVCFTVRLLYSTHVIDERKNKTNTSKLHTHKYNLYHCFVKDIFQTTAIHVPVAFGRLTCINRMLTVVCRPMPLFYER